MKVSVVMAFPTRQHIVALEVSADCTARQAVELAIANGLNVQDTQEDAVFDALAAPLGVYGERVADDKVLGEGDRVEIYRPLQQDPMELRRQRAALEPGRLAGRRK